MKRETYVAAYYDTTMRLFSSTVVWRKKCNQIKFLGHVIFGHFCRPIPCHLWLLRQWWQRKVGFAKAYPWYGEDLDLQRFPRLEWHIVSLVYLHRSLEVHLVAFLRLIALEALDMRTGLFIQVSIFMPTHQDKTSFGSRRPLDQVMILFHIVSIDSKRIIKPF